MAIYDRWRQMWDDQWELNKLFRPEGPPTDHAARTALTKEFVLHLFSECDELLRRSGSWRSHRRLTERPNPAALLEELSDIQKFLITVAQVWGFSESDLFNAMMMKSMVVRQRHSEEFVLDLHQASVIVDIDNVLADYVVGFYSWMRMTYPHLVPPDIKRNIWIDHRTLGLAAREYARIQHEFRISDWHMNLPVMTGAADFLTWCRERELLIILLTSRPIAEYPNLYGQTLIWLEHNYLPYNAVWWARDKDQMVLSHENERFIQFAVDDDLRHAITLAAQGILTFWLRPDGVTDEDRAQVVHDGFIIPVSSLQEVTRWNEAEDVESKTV